MVILKRGRKERIVTKIFPAPVLLAVLLLMLVICTAGCIIETPAPKSLSSVKVVDMPAEMAAHLDAQIAIFSEQDTWKREG